MQRIRIGTAVGFKKGKGTGEGRVVAINDHYGTSSYAKAGDRLTVACERKHPTEAGPAGGGYNITKRGADVWRLGKAKAS